ncbi:MAG: type II toxin-antitoxin system HicA family toxin [Clostridiales bacterium]|nr:type II toxin-antitoxin system HicA family toxin [Clostridiales bacterium]
MSKKDKLILRLLSKPSDFDFDEARSLLTKLGYREDSRGKTSGSRVAFINDETGHIIRFHRPHPQNQLKYYQIEQLIEELRKQGAIR